MMLHGASNMCMHWHSLLHKLLFANETEGNVSDRPTVLRGALYGVAVVQPLRLAAGGRTIYRVGQTQRRPTKLKSVRKS